MEKEFVVEKLKQALDNYNSYYGDGLKEVLLYMKKAKMILKDKNPENHQKLESLVSACKRRIIENNDRLIRYIVKDYCPKRSSHYDDFFQEGVIGLLNAIPGYNPERGEFSNYAGTAIRQNIQRRMHGIIENIRVPLNFHLYLRELKTLIEMFKEKYKRNPSDEELAKFSGKPVERINYLRGIEPLIKTDSTDAEINDKDREKRCLIDCYINPSEISPEEECTRKIFSEKITKCINNIPIKEDRMTLLERLEGKTLEEIATEKNITRERVRQRERRAIKRARRIREFYKLK